MARNRDSIWSAHTRRCMTGKEQRRSLISTRQALSGDAVWSSHARLSMNGKSQRLSLISIRQALYEWPETETQFDHHSLGAEWQGTETHFDQHTSGAVWGHSLISTCQALYGDAVWLAHARRCMNGKEQKLSLIITRQALYEWQWTEKHFDQHTSGTVWRRSLISTCYALYARCCIETQLDQHTPDALWMARNRDSNWSSNVSRSMNGKEQRRSWISTRQALYKWQGTETQFDQHKPGAVWIARNRDSVWTAQARRCINCKELRLSLISTSQALYELQRTETQFDQHMPGAVWIARKSDSVWSAQARRCMNCKEKWFSLISTCQALYELQGTETQFEQHKLYARCCIETQLDQLYELQGTETQFDQHKPGAV